MSAARCYKHTPWEAASVLTVHLTASHQHKEEAAAVVSQFSAILLSERMQDMDSLLGHLKFMICGSEVEAAKSI